VTLNNRRIFAHKAGITVNNNVEGIRNIDSTPYRQLIKEPIRGGLDIDFYITDEFEDLNPLRIASCTTEDNIVRNHNFSAKHAVKKINEYERSAAYPRGKFGEFYPNNQMLKGWHLRTSHPQVTIRVGLPEFKEGGANYKGLGVNNSSALVIDSNGVIGGAVEITQKDIFNTSLDAKYMVEITAKTKDPKLHTKMRVAGAQEVGILTDQYQTYLFEVDAGVGADLRIQFKGDDFLHQTVCIGSVKAYLKNGENFHDGFSGSIGPLTFADAYMTGFSFNARPFSPIMASAKFDVYGHISGQPERDGFCKGDINFHNNGILGMDDNPDIYDNPIPHGGQSSFFSITDIGITEALEFSYSLSIQRRANHEIGDLYPKTVTRGTSDIKMTLKGEGLGEALSFKGNEASVGITLFNISGNKIQRTADGALLDFDASREDGKVRRPEDCIIGNCLALSDIDEFQSYVVNDGVSFKNKSCHFFGDDSLQVVDVAGRTWSFGRLTGDMTLECLFKISPNHNSTAIGDSGYVRLIGRGDVNQRTYGLWYSVEEQAFLFQQQGPAATINVKSNRHEFDNSISGIVDPDHIKPDTWYYLTATRNAGQNNLFLNGKLVGSEPNDGLIPFNAYNSLNNLTIGYAGFNEYHVGEISSCRVYNRALSSKEVRQNFTNFSCTGKIVSQDISVGVNDVLQGSITIKEEL
jgi:hypothetical protein